MVLCIHIQTHEAPSQVERLVRLLLDTSRSVVIAVSHDRAGPPLDTAALEALGDVFVTEAEGGYGGWWAIQRWLDCLDDLDRRGVGWDWVTNISGTDLPLRPVHEIEDELEASTVDGYVEHFDVLSDESPWGRRRGMDRYWFRYRRLRPLSPRSARWLQPIQALDALQPVLRVDVNRGSLAVGRRVRPPFRDGFRCYGGAVFVTLARHAADLVRETARTRPDLTDHFQHCLTPGEAFVQTVLCNEPGLSIVNDHRRFWDFGRGTQHPRVLDGRDVAPALASGKDFARKWDAARDPAAVDEIEAAVRAVRRG